MPAFINLVGRRFGRLEVIDLADCAATGGGREEKASHLKRKK